MRTSKRIGISGATVALLLMSVPTAAQATGWSHDSRGNSTHQVDSADELQQALDRAARSKRADTIVIRGDIELDAAATYAGDSRLTVRGRGGASLHGTNPDADVLVLTTGAPVAVTGLDITGGRRGVVVVVPEDARGRASVRLHDVAVEATGHHGVHLVDGLVDLGDGELVPADADLPTEALVESDVVGGSRATVELVAWKLTVADSGRAALDQDGLRIDERGKGSVVAHVHHSSFTGNGADGIEYDEAGDGGVRAITTRTSITGNGDFAIDVDPDDGLDIDEAGNGTLYAKLAWSDIADNFDEGLDLDEEDGGSIVVTVVHSSITGSPDENLKATELGDGDVRAWVRSSDLTGSGDDAIQLEELDAGTVRGAVKDNQLLPADDDAIDLLSLDISESEFEELDDAELPLPTDGETGRVYVRGNGITADDVSTEGVEVVGDVQVTAFPAFTLSVLHINDGESDLLGDDDGAGSISRFGALLTERRDGLEAGDDAGAVTITSGDNYLASPELQASFDKGVPWYDSIALDHLDFDAFTIGNHEFDFGPQGLADFIAGFDDCTSAPFLSANLVFDGEPALAALEAAGCIGDSTVVDVDGRSVGIIGLTTPELREVSAPGGVEVLADLAGIANAEAQRLTDEGVEIILLASHLQAITNEEELASELSNIDAVIGGGGGEELEDAIEVTGADGATIPVVTVPGDYFDVGELQLEFTEDGALRDFAWALRDVAGDLPQDPFLLANVEEPIIDYVDELAETVVTTSEVGLNGVRDDVRTRETNVGNLLSDSYVRIAQERAADFDVTLDGPIVGLTNGGGIRNDSVIPAGEVTVLDTFDIAPFDNFVSITEDVSPEDLVAIVEHGLSGLPDAAGSFGQWSGLVVVYDETEPAGSRIVELTVNGTPYVVGGVLQAGLAPVDVATINFLANGNDGYDVLGTYSFTTLGVSYQQALASQLALADLSAGSVEYQERADVALRTRIIPVP